MIRYLLDTDIASYLIKGRSPDVEARYALLSPDEWAISAVSYAEILAGLEPLPSGHPLRTKAAVFLFRTRVLAWPVEAASSFATLRQKTRTQLLAPLDTMIAAHAIAIDATLVTNNTRHFSRVGAPLRIENWTV